MSLPPFPVDDGTLDLLSKAINPGPEAERSSVEDLLTLYSQLGGSDTGAVAEVIDERDPSYHVHDVLAALIAEVRRLRDLAESP